MDTTPPISPTASIAFLSTDKDEMHEERDIGAEVYFEDIKNGATKKGQGDIKSGEDKICAGNKMSYAWNQEYKGWKSKNIKLPMPQNSNPPKELMYKYHHMKEVRNVLGFIVNIHDATNFDIDLNMPLEQHRLYKGVISNEYTYQDLDEDYFENPNHTRFIKINPKKGLTYRCRLKGVGINQLTSPFDLWKANQMCIEIKQLIDRSDGWVICNLSDIDVYQRMLVDIIIHTSSGFINLRNYILTRMKQEDNPIFYSYSSRRHRNGK